MVGRRAKRDVTGPNRLLLPEEVVGKTVRKSRIMMFQIHRCPSPTQRFFSYPICQNGASGCFSSIPVVQPAEDRQRDNVSVTAGFGWRMYRRAGRANVFVAVTVGSREKFNDFKESRGRDKD